ncbi:hypothetical protein [uncultured Erythrobacter sp.]|uniref:hypothetical protein n=1 Tax=uncultured Erythrobacter sp. TaxID=263913 RepID=UPI0026023C25|nr:hypothetical protein [uncultured Erythrobacter sp.]
MTKLKKTLAKGTLGTVAVGAIALATDTPALASDPRGPDSARYKDMPAAERCILAVESRGRSAGFRYAKVLEINEVKRTRWGVRFEGRISLKGPLGMARLGGFNRGKFACHYSPHWRPLVDLSGVNMRR